MSKSELRAKYPNQFWLFSNVGERGLTVNGFESWLNYWVNEWGCESWEALELESRKYCVECGTVEGVTVDGDGVAWCVECLPK